jgi:hypothetical protein
LVAPHSSVILDAQNPLDLRPEDLLALADALENADRSIHVELGYNPLTGLGVTWWEVLYAWVPWQDFEHAAAAAFLLQVGRWARNRFKKTKRPQYVGILGPDGRLLKSVRVDADGYSEELHPEWDKDPYPRGQQPPQARVARSRARLGRWRGRFRLRP